MMYLMESDVANETSSDKSQRRTNSKSLTIFLLFMLLYVGIAIYSFIHTNKTESYLIDYVIGYGELRPRGPIGFYIISSLFLSMVMSAILLLIIHKLSRMLIIAGIVFEGLIYGTMIFKIISTIPILPSIAALLYFWKVYMTWYTISSVGTKVMSEIIRESCKAVGASPLIILLSAINAAITFSVAILTHAVYVKLKDINNKSENRIIILQLINLISGFWLISFIIRLTQIICNRIFSTWFHTKENFSENTFEKSVAVVLRYHLGTVAYASSLWYIFPLAFIMIKNSIKTVWDTRYNIILLIPCYLTTFWTLIESCCIVTATQSKSFKKSADTVCKLYLKHPLRVYAISEGLTWCLAASYIFIVLLITLMGIATSTINFNKTYSLQQVEVFFSCITILIFSSFLIVAEAVNTIAFCDLEKIEEEKRKLPNLEIYHIDFKINM